MTHQLWHNRQEEGKISRNSLDKSLNSETGRLSYNTCLLWGTGHAGGGPLFLEGYAAFPWGLTIPCALYQPCQEVTGREVRSREAVLGQGSVRISCLPFIPSPTCLFSPDWTAPACLPCPRGSREPLGWQERGGKQGNKRQIPASISN